MYHIIHFAISADQQYCKMQQNEIIKGVAHSTYKLIEYSIDCLQFGLSSILISHWVHHCYSAILDADST